MPENPRNRDCHVLYKGDTFAVAIDDFLAVQGWQGGQGVQWVATTKDLPTVTRSDGLYSGYALWGSNESSDQFTAMTGQFPTYRYLVMGSGGSIIMTRSFEKYTWLSRFLGGPLVPLVYSASDRLVFSLRGYWTKEDEWTASGDPRAPNAYFIGFVIQAPTVTNPDYMTIQTSI